MQRFTRFLFSTLWSQNCLAICSRLSTSKLFQQRVVHLKIALKVSLRLDSCLLPGRFWKIFYGATGHRKDLKIRSAAFLFTLSLPSCLCAFEASHDLCVATTVKNLRFSVYPVYGFAKRTMTARRRIFPSAPLSLF